MKLKGLSLKKNNINTGDYIDTIKNDSIKHGKNINLQMHNGVMSKITTNKIALNAMHTKMIVLENQSCIPFISGVSAINVLITGTSS